jgi:hypothetical protein
LSGPRRAVLGLSVAATIFALAAAFLTANGALYILAALAGAGTLVVWRSRSGE